MENAETSDEVALLFVQALLHVACSGDVFWCDDFLHLMDDTVDGEDVAFLNADGTVVVDVDAVGLVRRFPDGEFLVVECAEYELVLVLRELCRVEEGIEFVSAVDDAVIDDDFADGVCLVLVWEGVPRRFWDEFFLDEVFKVLLYGLVVGGKDRINTSCAQELTDFRIADSADVHLLKDVNIAAISRVQRWFGL